jgi:hypothetical protein
VAPLTLLWRWTKRPNEHSTKICRRSWLTSSWHTPRKSRHFQYTLTKSDCECWCRLTTTETWTSFLPQHLSYLLPKANLQHPNRNYWSLFTPYRNFEFMYLAEKSRYTRTTRPFLFFKQCSLTSNPPARWTVQVQDYDLGVCHIKGRHSFFSDFPSRNPAGLTLEQITVLTRPKELLVAKINLGIHRSGYYIVWRNSRTAIQDSTISEWRSTRGNPQITSKLRVVTLRYPYWRACMPTDLDISQLFG